MNWKRLFIMVFLVNVASRETPSPRGGFGVSVYLHGRGPVLGAESRM